MKKALALLNVLTLTFAFLSSFARAVEGKPAYRSPAGSMVVPEGLIGKAVQPALMEMGAPRGLIVEKLNTIAVTK